jgi:hypothetical protein
MHTYFLFFLFFLLFSFYFFNFLFFGLGPTQPTWAGLGWTHPARPGHWPKPLTGQISPASVRESRTLATITT